MLSAAVRISQTSLSHAIVQLEQELGVPLFEKNGRNVELTQFGEVFLKQVRQSLETLDGSVDYLHRIAAGNGVVRLGLLRALGVEYEDEQKELSEKIKKLLSEIEKQSSRSVTADMFIGLVRKYTRARKLTPRMLNELIEKIEVFNAEKIDGVWEQRLRTHYNCVGTIEIPTVLPLPIPEVPVNTRKGVVVNYAPVNSLYKKRVFLQPFKCYKNTRYGCGDRI